MLCDKCHKNFANVVLTQVIGNQHIKLYLCEECANSTEGLLSTNSFQQFLSGLLKEKQAKFNSDLLQCKKCGMTLNEFRKTSKIGCSECYQTFNYYLMPILKRIHGNTLHIGKKTGTVEGEMKIIQTIKKYEQELKKAIKEEEYEEAARLRDAIRALKKEAGIE